MYIVDGFPAGNDTEKKRVAEALATLHINL